MIRTKGVTNMDAHIEGDDGEYLKVFVTDNVGAEHSITFEMASAEIVYHEQDGYADDPYERTLVETEHVNQARRYAKYYVYRNRGYETLDRIDTPDSILAAMIALQDLPPAAIEDHFGELYEQVTSHHAGSPPELPAGIDPTENMTVYQQDLYVEPDPLALDEAVEAALEDVRGGPSASGRMDTGDLLAKVLEHPTVEAARSFHLEAVSGIHYVNTDGQDEETVHRSPAPPDREPDARIELLPTDSGPLSSFGEHLLGHLAFQVRDCYLCMGVEPPEALQHTGYGKFRCTLYQESVDCYEPYFDSEASIESWQPS